MIASSHLAVGALGGLLVQGLLPAHWGFTERVAVSFCAGLLSHIVVDAPFHQEYSVEGYKLGIVVLAEVLAVFCLVLSPNRSLLINSILFVAMAGAALPDLLGYIPLDFTIRLHRILHVSHSRLLTTVSIPLSIQLVISALAILYLRLKTIF